MPPLLQDPRKKAPRSLDEILQSLEPAHVPANESPTRSLDEIEKSLGGDITLPENPTPAVAPRRRVITPEASTSSSEFGRSELPRDTGQARQVLSSAADMAKGIGHGIMHPIDTAQALAKGVIEPAVAAARPTIQEQAAPPVPKPAFGSATTGGPEPFEAQQRTLDPGITEAEKAKGLLGTAGMVIAGPIEGKIANALIERWGVETAAAAIRMMGVRRAAQVASTGDLAAVVAAHTVGASAGGAVAGAALNPENPVQGAVTGAEVGPLFRGAGAAARGVSREIGLGAQAAAERVRARRAEADIPTADYEVVERKTLPPGEPPRAAPAPPPAPKPAPAAPAVEPERRLLPRAPEDVWTPEERAAYVTDRQRAFAQQMQKPWSQWTPEERQRYFDDQKQARTEARAGAGPPPNRGGAPEVVRVRTQDIQRDPERFQFKQGLTEEGVSKELKGTRTYNPTLAGVIGTWIDPADGKEYVVNGHHRDELAKRTGYPTQNAMRLQAKTAEEARSVGALMNIAEGRGTPVDVAKFLRDTKLSTEELEKQGISLRGDLARRGVAISKLAPDIFAKVAAEEIPIGHAVAIGEMLDTPELQREAVKAVTSSGKRLTEAEVREVARQVRDAGTEAVNQETLFGNETTQQPLYVERGQVAASVLRKLSTDRRVLGFVANAGRAEVLGKAGNKINIEKSKELADTSGQLEEVFSRLYTRGGPIASLLTEAARKVANGASVKSVSDELYPAITEAVRQTLAGSGGVPGKGIGAPQAAPSVPVSPAQPAPSGEAGSDEVKPYTSTDESQNAMFERPGMYGEGHAVAGAEHLWSALGRRIEAAPFEKGTAEQWAAHLAQGVSKGEKEFTGMDRFLKENAGKVIKKERIQQEFDKGRIRLEDRTLHKVPDSAIQKEEQALDAEAREILRSNDNLGFDTTQQALSAVAQNRDDFEKRWELDTPQQVEVLRRYADVVRRRLNVDNENRAATNRPRYEQYKEPGGENYREILVKLVPPGRDRAARSVEVPTLQWVPQAGTDNTWVPLRASPEIVRHFSIEKDRNPPDPARQWLFRPASVGTEGVRWAHSLEEARNFAQYELSRRMAIKAGEPAADLFKSPHFPDDPGLLGTLRVDDRKYGKEKVLFNEEFQSDWHQKGRKHGYRTPPEPLPEFHIIETEHQWVARDAKGKEWGAVGKGTVADREEALAYLKRHIASREADAEIQSQRNKPPDAPFKKTEEWLGLLMKRLIQEAISGGYDRVAWTNGQQQANRYDLSKHVDRLAYEPSGGNLQAWKGGQKIHEGKYDRAALPDVIGKEASEKLLAAPKNGGNYHTLEGVDLKIGGEGMRKFYDDFAPKVAVAIGKELGAPIKIEALPITTAATKNAALTAAQVAEFAHDGEGTTGEIAESTADLMRSNDLTWQQAIDQLEASEGGIGAWTSADFEDAYNFLQGMEETNPQREVEEPDDEANSVLRSEDVEELAGQERAAQGKITDLHLLLSRVAEEMAHEGDNWSTVIDHLENQDGVYYDREVWREAISRLRAADAKKLAERQSKAGGQPSFAITPELKAAAAKGMRMMEDQPSLADWGKPREPEQGSLLGDEAGRAGPPKPTAGGFSAKQAEAKEKADFLRKQLPRVTDSQKRIRLASEIASLDRIANFTEKVSPEELATRSLEGEAPAPKDEQTLDMFSERAPKDPSQIHLELTFGSVEKAKAAVIELVENSGKYVVQKGFFGRALTGEERLWNLAQWEKGDPLFQREQLGELGAAAWVTLKGSKVRSPEDLAQLLYGFRSPKMERLHFVLMDDEGTILDHQIDSSGALNYVQFAPGYIERVYEAAKAVGATQVAFAHNHPSGDPAPSEDDRRMTAMMQQQLEQKGLKMLHHIVLDHKTFAVITSESPHGPTIGSNVEQGFLDIPDAPETDWTQGHHGRKIRGPGDVAAVVAGNGRSVLKKGFAVLYMSTQHAVIALEPHSADALLDIEKWLPARAEALAAYDLVIVHEKELKIPTPNALLSHQSAMAYLHGKARAYPKLGRLILEAMAFDGTEASSQVYGAPLATHRYHEAAVEGKRVLEGDEDAEKVVSGDRATGDDAGWYGAPALRAADLSEGTLPAASRVGEPSAGGGAGGSGGGGQPPKAPAAGAPAPQPGGRKSKAVAKLPQEEPQGGVLGQIRRNLAPAGRTLQSAQTARAGREHLARLAHNNELAVEKLKVWRKAVGKLTVPERLEFIDNLETGKHSAQKTPELAAASRMIRTLLDQARDEVIGLGTGKLEQWIENYFPHIWKDASGGVIGKILGKRPLEGPKSFLKRRTIPTTKEGIAAGLEPVTDNPLDLALLKLREMNRYVMAHRWMEELKQEKLLQFEKGVGPPGYTKINDKIGTVYGPSYVDLPGGAGKMYAGGTVTRGAYWAPEPVATIINNYLAPGLRGTPLYDSYAAIGNVLNQAQLGLSAFHAGFTTADAMISNVALGIEQLAAGQFRQGAFRLMATSIVASPFTNLMAGHKLYRQYFNPQNNELAAYIDALIAGGGRVRMDSFYRTGYWQKLLEDLKHKRIVPSLKEKEWGAAVHVFPGFLELFSKPILEWLVPRQKLGVFFQLAQFELSRLPKGASRDEVRRVMADAWDAVDNRMGQLVYDNLFWNRALKDALMGSVRSVGWNLGTIRTVGGGILDIPKIPFDAARGKKPLHMSRDLAYVMGLTFFVILADSILNYFMSGETPEGRDFFAPRTGSKNDEGNPERVVLPTYMKDVIAYSEHPWETVKHKLNPAIALVNEMLENKDFYGTEIRNPDDPIMKKLLQELEFIGKAFIPFGVRNAQEQKKRGQGAGVRAANYIGITPANRAMTRTAAQNKLMEFIANESPQVTTLEQKKQRDARAAIRGAKGEGKPLGEAMAGARDAGLSKKQINRAKELSTGDPWADRFRRLSYPQAKIVFELGSEDEQRKWRFQLIKKRRAWEVEHGRDRATN